MRLPRFTAPNMVMTLIHSLYGNLFLLSFFRSLFRSFTLSLIHMFTGPFFHYRGCVTVVLLLHVVYNASYASFFAMELDKSLVNDDIRATCKTTLSLQTTRINFEKLLGRQVFKNLNFNPLQSYSRFPSVPPFEFARLFVPSFHVIFMFHSIW